MPWRVGEAVQSPYGKLGPSRAVGSGQQVWGDGESIGADGSRVDWPLVV